MLFNLTTRTLYLLAGNPHVTAALLDELSQSTDADLRSRVAEHENTRLQTLLKLIHDQSVEVRRSVALNPNSTPAILLQLAEDSNADVRYSIAENPLVSPAILRKLTGDENPYVAQRASETLARLQKLELAPQAAA